MTSEVFASDLNEAWLAQQIAATKGLRVLSLDCFDTLFWRRVVAPTDVFYPLAQGQTYRDQELSATQRQRSEASARHMKWVRQGSFEVNLPDIYREALPKADSGQIDALMSAELEAEIAHGLIFKPIAQLIQAARARGLKVIVVSDIYLSEAQIKRILFGTMPALEGQIDAFFASSTYGEGKTAALWKTVLAKMQVRPEQVLHLGDNRAADYEGASRFGIHARHLIQHRDELREMLEQRAQVALQLFPYMRRSAAVPSAYHAALAMKELPDAVERMGYATLGPILYGFARYLQAQAARLAAQGHKVKLAFLLRDGYLPALACEALNGGPIGASLNISRFTAIAASLRSEKDIQELLARSMEADNHAALLKQMLFPADEAQALLAKIRSSTDPQRELVRRVTQKDLLQKILARSSAFRKRLVQHVVSRTGVTRGDTLVFIDLGYAGTAQNLLAPVLRDELGVELQGRYLICAEGKAGVHDRQGLLDPSWIDQRVVGALTGQYIAAFEMMCTQHAPSTVDYDESGAPIYSSAGLDTEQHEITKRLQNACLQFIRDLAACEPWHQAREDMQALREGVAIDLARLLYFPTRWEIDCIDHFEFDFNLGTSTKLALVDTQASLSGMRRAGFMYMDTDLKRLRTNYPMELRYLDISLTSLLFAQNRLGFSTLPARASFRREKLTLVVANEREHTVQEVEAVATYDGYFAVHLPLSQRFHVAILLGAKYAWIQIESVQRVASPAAPQGKELIPGSDYLLDRIDTQGGGLCAVNPEGMVLFAGQAAGPDQRFARFVFRPLVTREQVEPPLGSDTPAEAPQAQATPAQPVTSH